MLTRARRAHAEPRRAQPRRGRRDLRGAVVGGAMLRDQLLLAQSEQLDAALERRAHRRTGEIGDHDLSIGAQIATQPPVHVRVDDIRRLAARDHGHVGVEPGTQRDAV
jgi:hypothetical protein